MSAPEAPRERHSPRCSPAWGLSSRAAPDRPGTDRTAAREVAPSGLPAAPRSHLPKGCLQALGKLLRIGAPSAVRAGEVRHGDAEALGERDGGATCPLLAG